MEEIRQEFNLGFADIGGIDSSEILITEYLMSLQNLIDVKETFQQGTTAIKVFFIDYYSFASRALQQKLYNAVCHVATNLQTKFPEREFWQTGKELFEVAERLVDETAEKECMKTCIARACEQLNIPLDQQGISESALHGQFPLDYVPPQTLPAAQQILDTLDMIPGSLQGVMQGNTPSVGASVLDVMVDNPDEVRGLQSLMASIEVFASIEASLQGRAVIRPMRPPPASKQVIENLPTVTITEESMARLGSDIGCVVCREDLVISEKMHELPCKHLFHLLCLKPWLDKHNSCPVCRRELPTDDEDYESWKELEAIKNESAMRIQ